MVLGALTKLIAKGDEMESDCFPRESQLPRERETLAKERWVTFGTRTCHLSNNIARPRQLLTLRLETRSDKVLERYLLSFW